MQRRLSLAYSHKWQLTCIRMQWRVHVRCFVARMGLLQWTRWTCKMPSVFALHVWRSDFRGWRDGLLLRAGSRNMWFQRRNSKMWWVHVLWHTYTSMPFWDDVTKASFNQSHFRFVITQVLSVSLFASRLVVPPPPLAYPTSRVTSDLYQYIHSNVSQALGGGVPLADLPFIPTLQVSPQPHVNLSVYPTSSSWNAMPKMHPCPQVENADFPVCDAGFSESEFGVQGRNCRAKEDGSGAGSFNKAHIQSLITLSILDWRLRSRQFQQITLSILNHAFDPWLAYKSR